MMLYVDGFHCCRRINASPQTMNAVPSNIVKLMVSPVSIIAKAVAKRGDAPIIGLALETLAKRTPVKFNSLPSGKLSTPAKRNHPSAGTVRLKTSCQCRVKANVIVIAVLLSNEISVPVVIRKYLSPSRAKIGVVPNPIAADSDRATPSNWLHHCPEVNGTERTCKLSCGS